MLERKKIKTLLNSLVDSYALEDFNKVKQISIKINKIIKKYPKLNKEKQNYILTFINNLVKIELATINYLKDKNIDTTILTKLNAFMLSNDIKLDNTNNMEIYQKLISLNLIDKKLISYNKLMYKYFESIKLQSKLSILKSILNSSSAELDLSYINNIKQEISKVDLSLPKDLTMIADLLYISRKTMINFDIDEIIQNCFDYALNQEVFGEKIIYFIQEMQNHYDYINKVNNWLEVNINKKTNDVLKQRITILYNIMLQQSGEEGKNKIKYLENPTTYSGIYYNFIQMRKDNSFKKEFIAKKINETVKQWTDEIIIKNDLKDKSNQLVFLYNLKVLERFSNYFSLFNLELNKVSYDNTLSNELIFFINDYSLINASLALPILIQAKKEGYFIAGTSPNFIDYYETNDKKLNKLTNKMQKDEDITLYKNDLIDFNYEIDIPNKRIMVEGYNIYQPVFEAVTRYQFTYFFNYETDAWVRTQVYNNILYFKRIFDYCDQLFEYCKTSNKKIRFLSNGLHVPQVAPYRIYCEDKGYKANMEFVALSPGYDNYFKNVGDALTETITLLNMNKNLNSRNAFLGTKEGFNQFYKRELPNIEEYRDKAKKYLTFNRSHIESENVEKKEILKVINEYKQEGKKIVLVNGKVVFDLCVKYTKGLCHDDMSDWLTHTVEIAKKNPNILLLLKPHPHEQRKDITMTDEPSFTFKNLIKTDMDAPNIIYLKPNLFKNDELLPFVDLGIIWNGTSCLEFLAQGIKTIAMDDWALKDYPIGMKNINSKQEYENIINNPDSLKLPEDIKDKAIMFLNYMGSDDVAYPNIYTKTSTVNYYMFENTKIFSENIDKLIKYGDPYIEDLVKRVVE